ncbi:MAG: hypothetical protein ACXW3O_00615, partial [Brevundimonas sp.]
MNSRFNGSSALAEAVRTARVGVRPSTGRVTNAFPQLSFGLDGEGIASGELLLASDPGLFATARAGGRNAMTFHSSRFDLGPIRMEDGQGVYVVPPSVLQRLAGAGARRLHYMAVGFSDREARDPVATTPPVDQVEQAPFVALEPGFSGATLSRVLGDPEGRGRVLSLGMTADGSAAPRRSPEAGRDVVERLALLRAPEPTGAH